MAPGRATGNPEPQQQTVPVDRRFDAEPLNRHVRVGPDPQARRDECDDAVARAGRLQGIEEKVGGLDAKLVRHIHDMQHEHSFRRALADEQIEKAERCGVRLGAPSRGQDTDRQNGDRNEATHPLVSSGDARADPE